jgi:hypothetical protein
VLHHLEQEGADLSLSTAAAAAIRDGPLAPPGR